MSEENVQPELHEMTMELGDFLHHLEVCRSVNQEMVQNMATDIRDGLPQQEILGRAIEAVSFQFATATLADPLRALHTLLTILALPHYDTAVELVAQEVEQRGDQDPPAAV